MRVSYLQPAETRPGLVTAIASTPGVAPYFDLSFQHASNPVLRRMRRFGDSEAFLGLLEQARAQAPEAGARSNFIVGFPGETEHDLEVLCDFLTHARLDAIGIFGYSDEDGTEAEGFEGKLDEDEIRERVAHVTALAEELTAQRAEERIGERVDVLVESLEPVPDGALPRGAQRTKGLRWTDRRRSGRARGPRVGDMISARWSPPRESTSWQSRLEGGGAMTSGAQRKQLERPQRPDHAAHRDGAVLRLDAAARRGRQHRPGAGSPARCSCSR